MKFIPIVLQKEQDSYTSAIRCDGHEKVVRLPTRTRFEELIPVVVTDLTRSNSLRSGVHSIGIESDTVFAFLAKTLKPDVYGIGILSDSTAASVRKFISATHDIGIVSILKPVTNYEIGLMENTIGILPETAIVKNARYRSLYEADQFSLGELDTMELEEIDCLSY